MSTTLERRVPNFRGTRANRSKTRPATYWLDSRTGSDANAGTSAKAPWRSLKKVNGHVFAPGERLLIRSGSSFHGQLAVRGEGTPDRPVVIDQYGKGPKPVIHGQGQFRAAVHLYNVRDVQLNNLEVTNRGPRRKARRLGVLVEIEDFGAAPGIVLRGLHVHDVNGSLVKGLGGAGIHLHNHGRLVPSWFESPLIEDCHVVCTDRDGITTEGYNLRDQWHPNRNVVVRRNLLEDIGGDGIVITCSDGVLVEHNTLRGGRTRCSDYAAGMWPWSCDNSVFQFNEVSGVKGVKDGQAFDSDWNCRNVIFQYNYSHDNEGGFMLVCNHGDRQLPKNIGNHGTVVRYNISQNDGRNRLGESKGRSVGRLIHVGGPVTGVHFYNNTFFVRRGLDIPVQFTSWGGWSSDARFTNNLFVIEGRLGVELGESTRTVFHNNAYNGECEFAGKDQAAVVANPLLKAAGRGGRGLDSVDGYQLLPGSPCAGAGERVPDAGGRDFWGNPVPANGPVDIGSHQMAAKKGTLNRDRGNR